MFRNILVPLDGSSMANQVLPHLSAIEQVEGSTITLLRVLETGDVNATPVDPLSWHFAKAEAQAQLDDASRQLALLRLSTNTVLLEGRSAQRIIEYTHRNAIDLLVLSTHGKGGMSGWKISGVALKVIHRAGTSIMLVRSSFQSSEEPQAAASESIRYHRILAPLDGSQRAEIALTVASGLAERHAAELHVVHVVKRPEMMQRVPLNTNDEELAEAVVQRNSAEAEKYLAQLQPRMPSSSRSGILVDESVSRALHRLVKQEQVDLVVLCAHGHTCYSEWPYSALVNSFITYGTTTLFILQDLPMPGASPAVDERLEESPNMPARKSTEDEGLNVRGHFDI